MFIDKTDGHLHNDVLQTLAFLLEKEVEVLQIRFVKDLSYLDKDPDTDEDIQVFEDGFIVEYVSADNTRIRRILLGESEMFVVGEPPLRKFEDHLGRAVIYHQFWYEFPVIWGELNEPWDEESDYKGDGMYASHDYSNFKSKYE